MSTELSDFEWINDKYTHYCPQHFQVVQCELTIEIAQWIERNTSGRYSFTSIDTIEEAGQVTFVSTKRYPAFEDPGDALNFCLTWKM